MSPNTTPVPIAAIEREREHAPVWTHRETEVDRQRRLHARDESRQTSRDRQRERATEQREKNALRQELPHEPNSLGAERGAHRELASSSGGAGQHQIREVRARDDEHQSDRGNEQESGGRECFVKVRD